MLPLTIVVPTRNEATNIRTFLAAIPPDVRLIVVDSSDDHTCEIIKKVRPLNTQVIHIRVNIPEARQIGAEESTTDYVLFTDADVTFAPDYFDQLRTYPPHDFLYGSKHATNDYKQYYEWFERAQRMLHSLGVPAVSGSNMIVNRQALMAVGGFDLALTVNEDTELGFRLKRQGYDVAFAPELRVYEHDHRRLHRDGAIKKTSHSLFRNMLLYFNLMPSRWRHHDWGYWHTDTK